MSDGIVVLGAGPAGLGLAFRAGAAGHRVTVIEREGRVGGAAGSFTVAGVRVDHGSHRLHHAIAPDILRDLRALLGDDLQRRPRQGRIRLAGRWLPFPLTASGTLRNLPPGIGVRAAIESLGSWARRPRADTFAEIVRAGLGPTIASRFYEPYAWKLWGLDPGEISGEQARRRITAATPTALLRRMLAGRDPQARTFLYPRRGFGQLWEAMATAAAARGAKIHLATTAVGVERDTDGVVVHLANGGEVRGQHLYSTVPLPILVRLLRPTAPHDVLAAAARLRTRAMVLVYLVLDRDRHTPFDAHYLPERWTPVTRLSEPKNYRTGHPGPHDAGDPRDRTVLCAEVPCARDDVVWRAPDTELARIVRAALRGAALPDVAPVDVVVRRLPSAYPIYDRGFAAHLDRVDRWVGQLRGVTTYGRNGLFVHDNSHHALAMAWAAADALRPDGTLDPATWSAARARFTRHVVED